jgi:hypothetical protein
MHPIFSCVLIYLSVSAFAAPLPGPPRDISPAPRRWVPHLQRWMPAEPAPPAPNRPASAPESSSPEPRRWVPHLQQWMPLWVDHQVAGTRRLRLRAPGAVAVAPVASQPPTVTDHLLPSALTLPEGCNICWDDVPPSQLKSVCTAVSQHLACANCVPKISSCPFCRAHSWRRFILRQCETQSDGSIP